MAAEGVEPQWMAREEAAFFPDRERSMAAGGSRSSELENPTILEATG